MTGQGVLAALGGRRPAISFEFFPPKDDAGEEQLWAAIAELEPLGPSYVSVTYGAGGSTRDRTLRVVARIARETALTPVAHLTCVGATRAELDRTLGALRDAGVETVLALRGDPPSGPNQALDPVPGGFAHAIDLVRLVRSRGGFTIGVAAFPEGHPEAPDRASDVEHFVAKCRAGADFAVTQFFFRVEDYVRFVEAVRARGCDVPVVPGVMPVTSVPQVRRMAELSGAALPEEVLARLRPVQDDRAAVRRVGVEIASELCRGLLDAGAPGLHFYTLNRSTATREIAADLGLAPLPG